MMNRRRWVLTGLLLAALTFALAGPFASGAVQAQGDSARLRFLHAAPGAPEVDVYVDGALVAPGLAYGEITPHVTFAAGAPEVVLRQAGTGAEGTPLASITANLTADLAFMLVIQGAPDALEMVQYEDILDPLEPGMARLTAINTIPDAPPLDVLTTESAPLLQGVSYSVQYGTINIPTGLYDLVMVPAGGEVTSAIATIGEVPLVSGTLYTFVALGTLEGDVAPSTMVLASPVVPPEEGDSVRVRIAHGSPDTPAVDVYAGDLLIAPAINLGQMTGHIPLPAGEVSLALWPAGSGADEDPLLAADVALDPAGAAMTIVVLGEAADDSLAFEVYPDSLDAVTPDNARLNVINAVPGATVSASLSGAEETTLASDVAAQAQAEAIDAAPGQYRLVAEVDAGDDEPVSVVAPEQPYFGGVYYTVLVYGGGADEAPIDARARGTEVEVTADSLPGGSSAVVAAPAEGAPVAAAPEETAESTPAGDAVTEAPQAATEAALDGGADLTTPTPAEAAGESTGEAPGEAAQPTPTPVQTTGGPIAHVLVDPGANLHCRQFPASTSLSLGLIPAGAQLRVLGRVGPSQATGEQPVIGDLSQMWLFTEWTSPQTGTAECWVSAAFLRVEYNGRIYGTVESLMAFQAIPSDRPGEVLTPGTGAAPAQPTQAAPADEGTAPPAAEQAAPSSGITGTVALESGMNLNVRDLPAPEALVVRAIPAGSTVGVSGRNADATWLRITYRDETGQVEGWVVAQYITVTQNGQSYDIMQLPDVSAGQAAPSAEPISVG